MFVEGGLGVGFCGRCRCWPRGHVVQRGTKRRRQRCDGWEVGTWEVCWFRAEGLERAGRWGVICRRIWRDEAEPHGRCVEHGCVVPCFFFF